MDEVVTIGRGYAPFPRRLLGLVIDWLILLTLFLGGGAAIAAAETAWGWVGMAVLAAFVVLYEPVLVSATGGTLGHLALNRRVFVILGYCLVVLIGAVLTPMPWISDACMLYDQCTQGEDLLFSAISLAMVLAWGAAVVLGWRGKLPGARDGTGRATGKSDGV